jgi:hypothetical protein
MGSDHAARAQELGLTAEFKAMQECRKGHGLADPARLIDLPRSLHGALALGERPTAPALRAAVQRLRDVFEASADEDRALSCLTWNLPPSPDRQPLGPITTAVASCIGLEWMDRCREAAKAPALPWNDERNIRRKSDRIILNTVISLAASTPPRVTTGASGIRLLPDQDASMPTLLEAAALCSNIQVDLLEYAGLTTLPLIRSLRSSGANIRLLVKHPDTVTGLQRDRTLTTLDTLFTSLFVDYPFDFECRCYRAPYSLRARRFGEHLLELGWLTPDIPRETTFGYNNPVLLVDPSDTQHRFLSEFFARTFLHLWTDDTTEDARAVLS